MIRRKYRAYAAPIGLVLLLSAATAGADTVWLTDGSIVKGEILGVKDDDLRIDTGFADEIVIDVDEIESIRSTRKVTITYQDDTEQTGYLRKLPDGSIYLSDNPPPTTAEAAAAAPTVAEVDSVDLVNLDRVHKLEQKRTYFWYESNVDLGINIASGNTESTAANIGGAIRPRFGKNRIDIDGQANRVESDDETTASNWRTQTLYTRELTTRWGAVAFASFENDEKQDLDLRSTIGAGISRVVFRPSPTALDVLLGVAYVKETFERCDELDPDGTPNPSCDLTEFVSDRDFGAIHWQLDGEQDIYTSDITSYHDHRLTMGVIKESEFIALTTTGLDFDLIGDLSLKLEFQLDYNSDPVSGNDKEDFRYLVKLSYDLEGDQNDWFK